MYPGFPVKAFQRLFLFRATAAASCLGFLFPAIFLFAVFFTRSLRLAPVRGVLGRVFIYSFSPCGPATTGVGGASCL